MSRKALLLLLLFSMISAIRSQDKLDFEHTIASEVFDKDRTISVRLPERYYQRDSQQNFSVIIVLDGQYRPFWDMAKSNISYMTDSYNMIPAVAVGIHSDNRGAEFTPPAHTLREHIEKEVLPFIADHYRVSDFKVLMGHSWAGQFISSTLFSDDSDLFNAYIAISPSLGYQNELAIRHADSLLSSGRSFPKFLYASTGGVGIREINFSRQVAKLDSIIKSNSNSGLTWFSSTFVDRGHWSCVIPSLSEGLLKMSRAFWADIEVMQGFARKSEEQLRRNVEAFNQQQDGRLGYHYDSDAHYLKFVAEDFTEQDLNRAAEQLYRWSIELDPTVVNTYSGLAYTLKKQEKFSMAKMAYQDALQCLEGNKINYPEQAYHDLKEWLTKKMAEL